ncbi:BnaC06g03290D [Brassica napus]|uniref:BnaC06g03290D protein n=1 Tax=Brassica napus TaxID=3708 RepID=A0A078HZ08_BRANA|nr:BnaC06g03290D [Brassica napus]
MSNQIEEISCFSKCPHLSTLFLGDNINLQLDFLAVPQFITHMLKGLRKLISLDLEQCFKLESIDGIGTSLPNLQVLKLYCSPVFIDARSIEELQLLEHLKILTVNVKDALILESIQRVERLASCVQRLWIFDMSATVLTLNTLALGGLRELYIAGSKISEIKIDWKSKEKEDLPSPYFKHLSRIVIFDLEGPKELTWLLFAPILQHLEMLTSRSLEEIINKEKGMSISNVHPDMTVPFPKLESLRLRGLAVIKRICSSPPALLSLKKIVEKLLLICIFQEAPQTILFTLLSVFV